MLEVRTISDEADSAPAWRERPLLDRPGFLIRRLHQIHTALFKDECAHLDVTPVQYSVMSALAQHGESDQVALAQTVGMDRTNIADVLARLEGRGLIDRSIHEHDRRMRRAKLTRKGRALTRKLDAAAERAHERTVDALPPKARERLLADLARLVLANNDIGRATLKLK
jgi:DNA-binding MarR family transcriptional regulator